MTDEYIKETFEVYRIPYEFRGWLLRTAQNNFRDWFTLYQAGKEEGFFSHLCSEFSVCYDNYQNNKKHYNNDIS